MNQIIEGVCKEPQGVKDQCDCCKRNPEANPGVTSPCPPVQPRVQNGACHRWLCIPARAQA